MNKDLLKSRNFLIGAVVLVIFILVGSFFLLKGSAPMQNAPIAQEEDQIPSIDAKEIGLELEGAFSENAVYLLVAKPEGIDEMEYEVSYIAEEIPRGAVGKVNLNKNTVRERIYLGTCSDVCHPDKDISQIKVVVKLIKDGKTYQSEASLDSFE